MDMCVDCAKGAIIGIKKYFKNRSVAGIVIMLIVFLIIPGISALFGLDDGIHIPITGYLFQSTLSINIWTFSALAALGIAGIIQIMIICYFLGFTKKISFETGIQYRADYTVKGDNIFYASATQIQKGRSDSAVKGGLVIVELFISILSGPVFFLHGLYTLRKLSSYVKK